MMGDINRFMDEIYTLEGLGILSDLSSNPSVFIGFDEENRNKAINYIKSIFDECYKAGGLRIAASYNEDELHGYAMLFVHPDPKIPMYLHKIHVKQEYRGRGIGKQIMEGLLESNPKIGLLCPSNKVLFYEKYGFKYINNHIFPKTPEFSLSKELYVGLCFMQNYKEDVFAPIFLLNDNDIRKILAY